MRTIMEQSTEMDWYKEELVRLLHDIEDQIPMEMPDIVLIMMDLDTVEKIVQFAEWVESKLDGDNLKTTAREIVRAAVWIGQGRTDLP